MLRHAGQMQQHRQPSRALHQRADRRAAQAENNMALPVTRHRPVTYFGESFTDQHFGTDMGLASTTASRPRNPQRSTSPQAGSLLATQRATALNVERLVDGFVADRHCFIARKVEKQTARNLLRTPSHRPSSGLPTAMPAAFPEYNRPSQIQVSGDGKTAQIAASRKIAF